MTEYVIGIDGGGTSTRAVVLDLAGVEVARAECAGAVVTAQDATPALEAVTRAVRLASKVGGIETRYAALWAGLAGAGRPDAEAAIADLLRRAGLADGVIVRTDVEAAFADAFGTGPGVMLLAGTGSIAWARDAQGVEHRVGGWGQDFGDEGGGYWIGTEALRCVARAEDGRGGPTGLRDRLLAHAGVATPAELIPWAGGATKSQIAGLVPVVAEAAVSGDPSAEILLARATEALAEHVGAVLERSGPWSDAPPLALWGGLVREGGHLRDRIWDAVTRFPVAPLGRALDPPLGAARLALKSVHDRS